MIKRLSGGLDMFVDLTADNLAAETLCCIIRTKKPHPGVECKRRWLAERLKEGHVFRKLEGRATVFIEYAPLEKAWTPVVGENYFYVYCLWTEGEIGAKATESRCWNPVWRTRGRRENPACACWARPSRRPG